MVYPTVNEQLISLSKRGIFPAPLEKKEDFFRRAASLPPLDQGLEFSLIQKLYDITPDWVNLIYKNDSLRFWEGGCTWEGEGKVTMQLRESFKEKDRLYGIYSKEELLTHEWVHAVRAPLNSIIFEEIFAYQSSPSLLRRTFGPIIRHPRESLYYVMSWLLFFLAMPWPLVQLIFFWINILFLMYGGVRLLGTIGKFNRVKRVVGEMLKDQDNVLPLMVHLTDEEMMMFSKMSVGEVEEYIRRGGDHRVRLEQVRARFLEPGALMM